MSQGLQPIELGGAWQVVRIEHDTLQPGRGAYALATRGGLVLHRDLALDEARALLATMLAEEAARAIAPAAAKRRR